MRKQFLFSFFLLVFTLQVFPQWSNNPNTPLIVGYGQDPKICSDGMGGCYITYTYETTFYPQKLAVERLDKWGYKSWGTKKQILGELPEQWQPEIIEDGYGNAIIGYDDDFWDGTISYSRSRVQKVDSLGNFLWPLNGVRVTLSEVSHGTAQLVPDNEGGVVAAFGDNNRNYFINRINSFGQRLWGDSGLFLMNYAWSVIPQIIKGDDQSYYFSLGKDLIKINNLGEIVRHDTLSDGIGRMASDGQSGVIVLYQSNQYYPNIQLRAKRINSSGINLWDPFILVGDSLDINARWKLTRIGYYFFSSWYGRKNGATRAAQYQIFRLDGSRLFSESIPLQGSIGLFHTDSSRVFNFWGEFSSPANQMVDCIDTMNNNLFGDGVEVVFQTLGDQNYTSDFNGGFIIAGFINSFTIIAQQVSKNGHLGEVFVPVELIAFSAEAFENNVVLNWQTASEINNKGFQIEKLPPSQQWEVISFVPGAGSTTETKSYSYTDNNIQSGKYQYRLKQIDFDGSFQYSDALEITIGLPDKFALYQNYPNPFNPVTTIEFSLPEDHPVKLSLFNILGEELQVLLNEKMAAGTHKFTLDASSLPSGLYLYSIKIGSYIATRKLILLK